MGQLQTSSPVHKTDKVENAVSGYVATLDGNGNLMDSGKTLGMSIPTPAAGA